MVYWDRMVTEGFEKGDLWAGEGVLLLSYILFILRCLLSQCGRYEYAEHMLFLFLMRIVGSILF